VETVLVIYRYELGMSFHHCLFKKEKFGTNGNLEKLFEILRQWTCCRGKKFIV